MADFDSTALEDAIDKLILDAGLTHEQASETLGFLAQKYTDLADVLDGDEE